MEWIENYQNCHMQQNKVELKDNYNNNRPNR